MDNLIIETKGLTKYYGNTAAVRDVDLHVRKGEIYALLGRNGAGKTTIMKMLLGLSSISKGSIHMFGKPLDGNKKEFLGRIGVMIETPGFYPNLTAAENLEILADLRGYVKRNAIEESLEKVGLPYQDKKLFSEFSLGMKQRLGIAAAIIHDPEVLILDEPINGLDPIGVMETRNFIRALSQDYGKTILLSSHILSEIELLADSIGIIDKGILLEESSYEELKRRNMHYILLSVEPAETVIHMLEEELHVKDYRVTGKGDIQIFDTGIQTRDIVRFLAGRNIYVDAINKCSDSLEDYFKRMTGGEGIG
jgi:bacitracin transport system ATP-binding protein